MRKSPLHDLCLEMAEQHGLSVGYHNPGDGARIRIFEEPGKDYFDSHPLISCVGRTAYVEAIAFLQGYHSGRTSEKPRRKEE